VDDAQRIRQQNEIDRLTADLSGEFPAVSPELINEAVRAEFDGREQQAVQDFVPIFAARSLRGKLRDDHTAHSNTRRPPSRLHAD
jgi:hypothetical protein